MEGYERREQEHVPPKVQGHVPPQVKEKLPPQVPYDPSIWNVIFEEFRASMAWLSQYLMAQANRG